MTSVKSKVAQVPTHGKEEERVGATTRMQPAGGKLSGGGSCAGAALRVRVRQLYNRADAVVP